MTTKATNETRHIKGTNPQFLIEKITRQRIYDSLYWKQECFGLTAESLIDKAVAIRSIGGCYGGNTKPTEFLCLVLKMLQLQPEREIVVEFINNEDFKYLRALGAFYMRLTGNAKDIYNLLEPLLNDYRKVRIRSDTGYELTHMDEFIDSLLREERVCDTILPRIMKRHILEDLGEIDPRVSLLEGELGSGEEAGIEIGEFASSRRSSSREDPYRKRSRSPSVSGHIDERQGDDESIYKDLRDRDMDSKKKKYSKVDSLFKKHKSIGEEEDFKNVSKNGSGGSKESMSIEETNRMRASLGLKPLKE